MRYDERMQPSVTADSTGDVYFVYDGDCPVCTRAAHALRIRQAVGPLHLIDAREGRDHPLVREVSDLGYDLDDGMVIKFGGRYYHGADALGIMALLGSKAGWFNRMNGLLFRSPRVAALLYPPMRGIRNALIRMKGVTRLNNLANTAQAPIFRPVFGAAWDTMPPVMHKRYANRPYTRDAVTVSGTMEVRASRFMQLLAPLLKWSQLLVPCQGQDVAAIVVFRSEAESRAVGFDREFRFPGKAAYHFRSRMLPAGGNDIIEYMSLGIGWRAACTFAGNTVTYSHRGYVWRVFGCNIPLPLHWVFGKGYAQEEATGDSSFRMHMEIRHAWFGEVYAYAGRFEVKDVSLDA